MSESTKRRADAIKAALALNLRESIGNAADVTIIGAGKPPEPKSGVMTPESGLAVVPPASPELGTTPEVHNVASPSTDRPFVRIASAPRTSGSGKPRKRHDLAASIASIVPSPAAAKQATYAKMSITLTASDLEVIERFHSVAREAGVKLRKGGNPSLFLRAALREFDDLGDNDPQAWARRLASVLSRESS
jgi:hypothetical protein